MTLLMRDQENMEKGMEKGMKQGMEKGMRKGIYGAIVMCREFGASDAGPGKYRKRVNLSGKK